MTGKNRQPNGDLEEQLEQGPWHFGFYQALRRLECRYSEQPRLGHSALPEQDMVRLGQEPTLQFAPSTLASFQRFSGWPNRLKVFFFGLFGPNGALPLHLTEFARSRIRNSKDAAFADFVDLFHHRFLSLFYRAWADKEPTVQLDRPASDRFRFYVGSLFGLGEETLQQGDSMPDHVKLHFAAHLGCHTHHAEGLVSIVRGFFVLPVQIEEFVGEWLDIPVAHNCYLNDASTTGQLGRSAVIGTRSWQCQNKFRLRLGPLDRYDFDRMLPLGESLKRLRAVVRNYTGFEFCWDLNLILKREQVPAAQLGEQSRVGGNSWVITR